MRRAVAIALAAGALLLVGAVTPAEALARDPPVRLTIVTLPKLVGIRFALDGRTFVTGRSGYARIKTTPGTHLLQALDTSVRRPSTRSTFLRWSDGRFTGTRTITISGNTRLSVGYRQSVLVSFRFIDPAGHPVVGRVTRLTLSNTLGGQPSFQPEWPQWLPAISITRRFSGLAQTLVRYSIKQALVGGSDVVNQAQQRFYPALTRQVTARLLLYSARVSVRDFLLGTSAGSRLQLVYPNGFRSTYPLHGKELRLSSLPRGTYQVEVRGGGYAPAVSVALSRNQVLRIRVISYLDMFLFLVMAFAAVAVLALVARPYLRLRLRSLGTGRQPTLDDLEPVKPLSGARKELIVRYMVPAPAAPQRARGGQRLPARSAHGIAIQGAEDRAPQRLRTLPRRIRAAAVDRLRRFQDSRRRIRRPLRLPAAHREPPEALSGERIELVHVYMGGTIAPAGEVAGRATPVAQEPGPAPPVQAIPPPEVEETAAPASAAMVAPPRAEGVLPGNESVAEPVEPERDEAAPKPTRTRTPAGQKTPAGAKAKTAGPAKEKASRAGAAKPKAKTTKANKAAPARKRSRPSTKAKTVAPAKRKGTGTTSRPKTKPTQGTEQAASQAQPPSTPVAANGTAESEDMPHWPDLAAAVEALREDLRNARTTPPKKRKRSSDAETTAPAKPKAARSAKKPKTKKATKGTEQGAAQGPASPTSAAANGAANIEELAHFRPDLAAAVEALQGDLRNARTATTKKGRRKSSAEAR